jgi:hypothetical protein
LLISNQLQVDQFSRKYKIAGLTAGLGYNQMELSRVVTQRLQQVVVDISNILGDLLIGGADGGFVNRPDFGQGHEGTALTGGGIGIIDDPAMEGLEGDGKSGVIGDDTDKLAGGKVGDR